MLRRKKFQNYFVFSGRTCVFAWEPFQVCSTPLRMSIVWTFHAAVAAGIADRYLMLFLLTCCYWCFFISLVATRIPVKTQHMRISTYMKIPVGIWPFHHHVLLICRKICVDGQQFGSFAKWKIIFFSAGWGEKLDTQRKCDWHMMWFLLPYLFNADGTEKQIVSAIFRVCLLTRKWRGRSPSPFLRRPSTVCSLLFFALNVRISSHLAKQLNFYLVYNTPFFRVLSFMCAIPFGVIKLLFKLWGKFFCKI